MPAPDVDAFVAGLYGSPAELSAVLVAGRLWVRRGARFEDAAVAVSHRAANIWSRAASFKLAPRSIRLDPVLREGEPGSWSLEWRVCLVYSGLPDIVKQHADLCRAVAQALAEAEARDAEARQRAAEAGEVAS